MKITFDNIDIIGDLISENELYEHYHYPEMLIRYDSNFIAFKRMPTVQEFIEAEAFLREFHKENGQNHVKFVFPPDQRIHHELMAYLKETEYITGVNELYAIKPSDFPRSGEDAAILVVSVNENNFGDYLNLQYEQDLQFGEDFAKAKVKLHESNFHGDRVVQVIAYYQGNPAGAVDVIVEEETAEIDGLFVEDSLQRKGIGSKLQQFVMDTFHDRTVILIADGEDTPREMYQKQNYQLLGIEWDLLKVF